MLALRQLRPYQRLLYESRRLLSTGPENLKYDLSTYGNVLGGEIGDPKALETFRVWHTAISKSGGTVDVKEMLAPHVSDDIVFHPPTYFKPWKGKGEFLVLMEAVSEVFGDSFEYGRQWISPTGHDWALEFNAQIGDSGKGITGIDLVKLDDEGRILDFMVLARPPSGVALLKEHMMKKVPKRMIKLKAKQAMSSIFGS